MTLVCVGVDHRSAPLDVLERVAISPDHVADSVLQVRALPGVREAAVLATCGRTEVYAVADDPLPPVTRWLGPGATVRAERAAVEHLFAVAAGLESHVLGEPQILRQVRRAAEIAREVGSLGPIANGLWQRAIGTGRRVRKDTAIGAAARSLADAGVALARTNVDGLRGRTVLVVGAGKMGALAIPALRADGAEVLVANRTPARAQELAERNGARAVELDEGLALADVVLTATSGSHSVITRADAERLLADRPVTIVDLALPRDVAPDVRALPNVTVFDLDDLRVATAADASSDAIAEARALVVDAVDRFEGWRRARTIRAIA